MFCFGFFRGILRFLRLSKLCFRFLSLIDWVGGPEGKYLALGHDIFPVLPFHIVDKDRAISGSLRIYSCDSFYLKAKKSVFLSAGLQMVSYSDCRLTWDWTTGCLVMCVLHG